MHTGLFNRQRFLENKTSFSRKFPKISEKKLNGYWLVPNTNGRFTKIGIFETTDLTCPVEAPIWLAETLGPSHWLNAVVRTYYSRLSESKLKEQICAKLFKDGWAFVTFSEGKLTIGCKGDPRNLPYFEALAAEIEGLEIQAPMNIRLETTDRDYTLHTLTGEAISLKQPERLAAEKLNEITYRRLFRLTSVNGGYKVGGMRKITVKGREYWVMNPARGSFPIKRKEQDRTRWVYDKNVPGRVENGTRFVVTQPPTVQMDPNDASQVYTFNFKSRDDRCTTGMRQVGYLRYLPLDKNWLRRLLKKFTRYGRSDWDKDVHVFCSCLSAEAKVLRGEGYYDNIANLRPGDTVFTHTGRACKVTDVARRKRKPGEKVYWAEIAGFPEGFYVTEDHPFYLLRGNDNCLCGCGETIYTQNVIDYMRDRVWSPAMTIDRKFKLGHWAKGQTLSDSGAHFEWIKAGDFRPAEWALCPWLERAPVGSKYSPSKEFARLVGYYAAEGHIPKRGRQVVLTFNIDERETLVRDVVEICQTLGYKSKVAERGRFKGGPKTWITVHITNKEFRDFCLINVGQGPNTKRLSSTIMNLWEDAALRQLYIGMHAGDGTVRSDRMPFVSCSFDLASQSGLILSKLRIASNVSFHSKKNRMFQCKPVKQDVGGREIYETLCELQNTEQQFDAKKPYSDYRFNEGTLKRVRLTEVEDFDDWVYDIRVDDDNSFIANGIAVHNCPDFKYRWHKVLFDNHASHTPKGGVEATNQFPKKTNPSGKLSLCVAKGERVHTLRGLIPIEEVIVGDKVWTLQGWRQVTASALTGHRETVEIEFKSGRRLRVTPDHILPVLSEEGVEEVEANSLCPEKHYAFVSTPGDIDPIKQTIHVDEFYSNNGSIRHYPAMDVELDETFAELTGYMVSEGSPCSFAGENEFLLDDFFKKWTSIFGPLSSTKWSKGNVGIGAHGGRILESTGFIFGSENKTVPEWVFRSGREIAIAFLRGAYAGDGNFRNRHSTYASISGPLARGVQSLLQFVGVTASLDCYNSGVNSTPTWFVRTSSHEETEKLYHLLNPIRGRTVEAHTPSLEVHSSRHYVFHDSRRIFEAAISIALPSNTDTNLIEVNKAAKLLHLHEGQRTQELLSKLLSQKGLLKKTRLRNGGKETNVARICDLFEVAKNEIIKKIIREIKVPPKSSPYKINRSKLAEAFYSLQRVWHTYTGEQFPENKFCFLKAVIEAPLLDCVVSVDSSSSSDVYDLTIEEAEHFSVNGTIVHNCKHLVALGAYLQMTQDEFKKWQKDREAMIKRGERPSKNPMLPPVISPGADTEDGDTESEETDNPQQPY